MHQNISPFANMENDLNDWVLKLREEGCIMTRTNICMCALQLCKDEKYGIRDFKATAGWCTRFMNRCNLTLRQRTHIAQKLRVDLDEKITKFHRFVINERNSYD